MKKPKIPSALSSMILWFWIILACVPSLLAFFAESFWFFDLFTHFRVQYAITAMFLLVIFAFYKRKKMATVSGLLLLLNLGFVLPVYFPAPNSPNVSKQVWRVASINVLSSNLNHSSLLAYIKRTKPDFFVLIEIDHRWAKALESLKKQYPFSKVHPLSSNFGIGFWSRLPIQSIEIKELGTYRLPAVFAKLKLNKKKLNVVGLHTMPPVGAEMASVRNHQLQQVATMIQKWQEPTLLMGDLNLTPWSPYFSRLLHTARLRDSRQGFGIQASWPQFLYPLFIPIDHILVRPEINIIKRVVGPALGSDHRPIWIDFSFIPKEQKD